MELLTPYRLRILLTIAEHGSFNRAASALLQSQSAVSQQVQLLESSLGVVLFERSPRGVTPTRAGRILLTYAEQIIALVAEARRAVVDVDSAENQTLTIAATSGVSVYILPPWLRRFQEEHPNVHLSQQTGVTADVMRGVLDNQYDFGLIVGTQAISASSPLQHHTLATINYHLVVHPEHAWATRETVALTELATVTYLHRQPTSRSRQWLDGELGRRGVQLKNVALFNTPGAIKYALLSNMGVSILPAYVVEREIDRGELVQLSMMVETQPVTLTRPLLLLWRSDFRAVQIAFLRTIGHAALVEREVTHERRTVNGE